MKKAFRKTTKLLTNKIYKNENNKQNNFNFTAGRISSVFAIVGMGKPKTSGQQSFLGSYEQQH
jgi:hypothetical protein